MALATLLVCISASLGIAGEEKSEATSQNSEPRNSLLSRSALAQCVDRMWEVTWKRFYLPQTHLFYDYLTSYESGRELAHLPTADEVQRQYPNECGYGTGMEDCMISAGVMLSLIVDRYAVTQDETLRQRALDVLEGIRLCATVHEVPGFVARGVCVEDSKSIYPNSSRDQYTHAVHGLWLYFHSPLCRSETKTEIGTLLSGIADRMTRTVTPENDYDSLRADGTRDTRGISRMWNVKGHEAARLPMIYAAAWDVTKKKEYYDLYRKYLEPAVEQSFSVEDGQPTYAWLQMQASLELLVALERDATLKQKMHQIMALVARRCASRAETANKTAEKLDLTMVCSDWRTGEGLAWKGHYRKVWYCIRESGEAALAQLMVEDAILPEEQQQLLLQAITRLDCDRVSSNGIFYLQAAYWKARREAGVFEGAAWIRDPAFRTEKVLGVFDAHRSEEKSTRLKAVHTYFRKQIELPSVPKKALLWISGDDYYKFYVNGRFVEQGPEPAYPFVQPYYRLDVTRFLEEGSNCLAAHVYYHGLATRAFNSADNRSGLVLKLELSFADGSKRTVETDRTWRCLQSKAFPHDRIFGYATQFNENIDMREVPIGWRRAGFDDSAWLEPLVEWQDHRFVEAVTPPLQHWRADPVVFKEKSPGRFFIDFGGEVVGHTRIRVQGRAGHVMTVWHGEELLAPGDKDYAPETVRHAMRCNCDYQDKVTLTDGENLVEFYDYRGFRYVELIDASGTPEVWVDVRHHRFDEEASSFDSSSEILNGIWRISKRGVQMGCQGVIVDCPTREKGQYTGDTYMTVLSQLLLTGDRTLTKAALLSFHHSQRFDQGMLCVAPGGFHQELAEWSLLWPVMMEYYYQVTGDRQFVVEMVDAGALDQLMDWFGELETSSGLLAGVDRRKWVLVDWPANLRGGYDYEGTKDGVNTVINAFYYGSLRSAARLMRDAGRDGTVYDRRADRLRAAFHRELLDPDKGICIDGIHPDGKQSPGRTLHASSFPLHFGLVPKDNVGSVVELIRQERLNCGLYGAPYLIMGLYRSGQSELAYDLLTCQDKHSWHEMLRNGATTTMEAWAPELKWNTSWCHPACATPIWLIVEGLMGLTPDRPGWKSVRVAPQVPQDLEYLEVRLPIPAGSMTARYEQGIGYTLTLPEGIDVVDETPCAIPLVVRRSE
jgi:hypothetical protein